MLVLEIAVTVSDAAKMWWSMFIMACTLNRMNMVHPTDLQTHDQNELPIFTLINIDGLIFYNKSVTSYIRLGSK